jgi:hypothetical protein
VGAIGRQLGGEGLTCVRDADVLRSARENRRPAGAFPQPHDETVREARHDQHRLLARQKSWDAFRNDPEWNRVRTESEASGKIVEKIDSVFLKATDYSRIK